MQCKMHILADPCSNFFVSGLFYREIITGLILSVLDLKSTGIKNKEEEVSVSRKRHPNSKHLLPALQAALEHPHEKIIK